MQNLCYLNGAFLPLSEARVSVLDRGFLFGDGVYEVLRVYRGKLFRAEDHFKRLSRSLDGLRIQANVQDLSKVALDLLGRSGLKEASLYIQVSRGAAPERKHFFPGNDVAPTVFMFVTPYDDSNNALLREQGAKAITFPDVRWGRVDLKTVNLLGNVLAAQAAKEAGVYEAIFVNEHGVVTEGSHTNVFAVVKGKLRTYPLSTAVLPGVTRLVVFDAAKKEGISIEEKPITKEELYGAEEIFISATSPEVLPIIEVDGKRVGLGRVGETTRRLQTAFRNELETFMLHS